MLPGGGGDALGAHPCADDHVGTGQSRSPATLRLNSLLVLLRRWYEPLPPADTKEAGWLPDPSGRHWSSVVDGSALVGAGVRERQE